MKTVRMYDGKYLAMRYQITQRRKDKESVVMIHRMKGENYENLCHI